MKVFQLRQRLIEDYGTYVRSFIEIRDARIRERVREELDGGLLWPQPLIQLNPAFEPGGSIEDLVGEGLLHQECQRIFRVNKSRSSDGKIMRLYRHQVEAIRAARGSHSYVLTTGTGSGKSLAYIVPIVDFVLRDGSGRGIRAIVVYPMNALANSQLGELQKFLCEGYPDGKGPVTFARYTGQENDEERQEIIKKPPDILLTNYVMLELLLTRPYEQQLITAAKGLQFLVLDELHTYRGRQGADVAMLVRRAREAFHAEQMQCVGTSATLAGSGSREEQRAEVARVASSLFGTPVHAQHVIGETLRRSTVERDFAEPAFVTQLTQRVADQSIRPPVQYERFIEDPLSIWIEGLRNPDIGAGNGMAGALEIATQNQGGLQVWTGDVVYRLENGGQKGFAQMPAVPGTGVMFSLDTRKPVDLTETWIARDHGWSYINAEAERIAGTGGIRVADECINTGTRPPAQRLRRKVQSLLPDMAAPLVLDFTDVRSAASSFLDELLGRLAGALGVDEFHRRVQIAGMEPLIRQMANVVIEQRLGSEQRREPT